MRNFALGIALVSVLSLASVSQAALHVVSPGDTLTLTTNLNYRTGSGGEFQLGLSGVDSTYFHTFCAETGENLASPVYVQSVGFKTVAQGGTLKEGAANLYRDYYDAMVGLDYGYQNVVGGTYTGPGDNSLDFTLGGGLFTFDMTDNTTRRTSGASVQKVLWNLLGYGTGLNATETSLRNYYQALDTVDGSGDFRGVRIANLVRANNHSVNVQDQFVVIPEPATILVWSALGCLGIVALRRHANRA